MAPPCKGTVEDSRVLEARTKGHMDNALKEKSGEKVN